MNVEFEIGSQWLSQGIVGRFWPRRKWICETSRGRLKPQNLIRIDKIMLCYNFINLNILIILLKYLLYVLSYDKENLLKVKRKIILLFMNLLCKERRAELTRSRTHILHVVESECSFDQTIADFLPIVWCRWCFFDIITQALASSMAACSFSN